MVTPTVSCGINAYDGGVDPRDQQRDQQGTGPLRIGHLRALGYVVVAGARILGAILVVAMFSVPVGLVVADTERSAGGAGAILAIGLALLGIGLPGVAVVLATGGWSRAANLFGFAQTGRPDVRFSDLGTLVRPLAYAVVMLTLGGAIVIVGSVIIVGAGVAFASPALVAAGDRAVIGPVVISNMLAAIIAIVVASAFVSGLIVIAPWLARAHARVTLQMLTRPEQRLERALSSTELSRSRLVRAFDIERSRIERDLHDGVQPRLMTVSMTLGLALAEMPIDAPGRADVLRAQGQARETIETLRRFVRNIHPQVLVDHGIGAAIRELADGLTLPITTEDALTRRLSPELEANLFFCVAELLTNTVKHSGADRAEVVLSEHGGAVRVVVTDDGLGGARADPYTPGGLEGISDRLAAFGGGLAIDSPVGGPTTAILTATETRESHDGRSRT